MKVFSGRQTAQTRYLHRQDFFWFWREMTPKKLRRIMEYGTIVERINLYDQMEHTDAHLYSDYQKRKRAILSQSWGLFPTTRDKQVKAEDDPICQELQEILLDMPELDNLILGLADGIGKGFSCIELDWKRQGNLIVPKECRFVDQSLFKVTNDGITLDNGSLTGEELWPMRWIVHQHEAQIWGRHVELFRVLAEPWLMKKMALNDFAHMLEVHGMPIRIGYYPPGTDESETDALLSALQSIGHDAAGIVPDNMKLEFQQIGTAEAKNFMSMIDHCNNEMSKAILGATLTTQAQDSKGSYALGKVHNEVRHDLLTGDSKQIADTITKQLITYICQLNWNTPVEQIPKFQFIENSMEDVTVTAQNIAVLNAAGLPIPLAWAYEKCGIPQPQDGEPVLPRQQQVQAEVTEK